MFYDDHCKTENERRVYKAIVLELSKNSSYIAIQELYYLNIPRPELNSILAKFWEYGLFTSVVLHENEVPTIFSIQQF